MKHVGITGSFNIGELYMSIYTKIILFILSLPKTIYFNLKYFKLKDAIRLPVLISHRVVLDKLKGEFIIEHPISFGLIKIGFGGVRIFDRKYSRSVWCLNGRVIFKGRASLGYGTKLSVFGGEVTFGRNFAISAQTQLICNKCISFGDDVLIGWDCLIMDTDAHHIMNTDGKVINEPEKIIIGNRVWIGARCTIIKGTIVGNDVVVATNSCMYGKNEVSNCIVGGNPVRVLKENITWKV